MGLFTFFRLHKIFSGLNNTWSLKKKKNTNSPSRPKRDPRPWRQPQLRKPRRLDSQEDREQTIREQHAADAFQCSFRRRSRKAVAHGVVPHRTECFLYTHSSSVFASDDAVEQHPSPVLYPAAQISRFRTPVPLQQQSMRGGTLSSLFRAGRRLCRSWMVHQCWCSTSTIDFSFLVSACVSPT